MANLTELLHAVGNGDSAALNELHEILYLELRELARLSLRRAGPVTALDTTSLVHESYLRLANAGRLRLSDRNHFFAYSARVMRSVIIDLVRHRSAKRRGGDRLMVTLNTAVEVDASSATDAQVLRLNELLEDLAKADPRLVQVVEMRYFAGMSEAEIAAALGVTERTVRRDWQKARLLLRAALA